MPPAIPLAEFDAVLFDVDGTLVDTLGAIIPGLRDAYVRYAGHAPSDEEIARMIGMPLTTQLVLHGAGEAAGAELQERVDYAISRFEAYKEQERLFEPAIAAMHACRRAGLKVALVTSKSALELELLFERFPFDQDVDTAITASDVIQPKPHPEGALLACERLGVRPEKAVFIGDSVFDMRAARGAGCVPVAVAYGSSPAEPLLQEAPAALFHTPEELLAWVEANLTQTHGPKKDF